MNYGFDIGGSKIALGVFDANRRLQWETRVATPHDSYTSFCAPLLSWLRKRMRVSA